MGDQCINCGKVFEKKTKGFKRKSIDCSTKFPAVSLRNILQTSLNEPITPEKQLFICDKCASTVVKVHSFSSGIKTAVQEFDGNKSDSSYLGKRQSVSTVSSTPKKSGPLPGFSSPPSGSPLRKKANTSSSSSFLSFPPSTIKKKSSFIDKATSYLRDGKYFTCFKLLIQKSKPAKEGFIKTLKHIVNKEIKSFSEQENFLSSRVSESSLESFNWSSVIGNVEHTMPALTTALKSGIVAKKNEFKVSCNQVKPGSLVPAYGFMLSSLLHHRLPSKAIFLQETLSVEMYRSGCNQKLFKWLNKLGLCRSVTATRSLIDRICSDFDREIKTWKNNIQHDLGNLSEEVDDPAAIDIDEDISHGSSNLTQDDRFSTDSSETESVNGVFQDDDLDGIVPLLESSTFLDEEQLDENVVAQLDPGFSLCWDNVQKLSVSRHKSSSQNNMMLWALCFATRNRISFRHLDYDLDTRKAVTIPLEEYLPSDQDWVMLRHRMEVITQRILKKNFEAFSEVDVVMHIPHRYSAESSLKSEIVNLGVIKENPSTCRGVIEISKHLHKYVPAHSDGQPFQVMCHGDQLSVERMVDAKLAMAGSEQPYDKLTGLVPRPQGFHKRNIILQDAMNEFYNTSAAAEKGSLFQIRNKFEHRGVKKKISDCVNSCVDLWNFTTEGYVCLLACKLAKVKSLEDCPEDLLDGNRDIYVQELSSRIVDIIWPNINSANYFNLDTTTPYCESDETLAYEEEEEDDTVVQSDDEDMDGTVNEPATHDDDEDHVFQHSCGLLYTGLKLMADKDAERENDGQAMIANWRINMIDFFNGNHNKYLILGHRIITAVNG